MKKILIRLSLLIVIVSLNSCVLYNMVAGIEGAWKNLRFGTRFHLGLTDYFSWDVNNGKDIVHFKHASITIYLGYTLWNSKRSKEKRLERKAQKKIKKK